MGKPVFVNEFERELMIKVNQFRKRIDFMISEGIEYDEIIGESIVIECESGI